MKKDINNGMADSVPKSCNTCGGKLERAGPLYYCPNCRRFPDGQHPIYQSSWTFGTGAQIDFLSIAPDGSYIALGSRNGGISIVDPQGLLRWQRAGATKFISISPDGDLILLGSEGSVRLLDRNGTLIWERFIDTYLQSGHFSRDASTILAASLGSFKLLDRKGETIQDTKTGSMWNYYPNGDMSIIVTIKRWNPELETLGGTLNAYDAKGTRLWWFRMKPQGNVRTVHLPVRGDMVLLGGANKALVALGWDGKVMWQKRTGGEVVSIGTDRAVTSIVAASLDGHVYAYGADGKPRWKHDAGEAIAKVAISGNGSFAVAATYGNRLLVFDGSGGLIHERDLGGGPGHVAIRDDGMVLSTLDGDSDLRSLALLDSTESVAQANRTLAQAMALEQQGSFEAAVGILRGLGISSELARALRAWAEELAAHGNSEYADRLIAEASTIQEWAPVETRDARCGTPDPRPARGEAMPEEGTAPTPSEGVEEFPLEPREQKKWGTIERELRLKAPVEFKKAKEGYEFWAREVKPKEESTVHVFVTDLARMRLMMDEPESAKALYAEAADAYHRSGGLPRWGEDCFKVYLGKGPVVAAEVASDPHNDRVSSMASCFDRKNPGTYPGVLILGAAVARDPQRFSAMREIVQHRADSIGVQIGKYFRGLRGVDGHEARYVSLALAKCHLVDGLFTGDTRKLRQGFEFWTNLERLHWDTGEPYPHLLVDESMTVLYDIALMEGLRFRLSTPFIPRSVLEKGYWREPINASG